MRLTCCIGRRKVGDHIGDVIGLMEFATEPSSIYPHPLYRLSAPSELLLNQREETN
ncbi:MAG: hypothetical protein ACUVQ9_02180 [Thermodesulfobacteriota bacterium]